MRVLLKSLEELEKEYGIKKIRDNYYFIIGSGAIATDMINLLGKIVKAKYDKVSDSYVVDDWYFHPNLIKGEVIDEKIKYKIKRPNDGLVMTYYIHNKERRD